MVRRLGAIAIPAFIVIIIIFYVSPSEAVFEPPLLVFILNTLFISIVAFVGSYISGKSYLMSGAPGLILFGCGLLTLGTSALLAGLLRDLPDGANLNVTVYNTGALLASAFHVAGATLVSMRITSELFKLSRKLKVIFAYLAVLVFLTFVAVASLQGVVPRFFIQGVGPTPTRQLVLVISIALFAASSFQLILVYSKSKADFVYWYCLAVALIAIGLSAVLVQKAVGSPIGWAGRIAQYLGGIYLLVTVLTTVRGTPSKGA